MVAPDLRCHGATTTSNDDDLSAEVGRLGTHATCNCQHGRTDTTVLSFHKALHNQATLQAVCSRKAHIT